MPDTQTTTETLDLAAIVRAMTPDQVLHLRSALVEAAVSALMTGTLPVKKDARP